MRPNPSSVAFSEITTTLGVYCDFQDKQTLIFHILPISTVHCLAGGRDCRPHRYVRTGLFPGHPVPWRGCPVSPERRWRCAGTGVPSRFVSSSRISVQPPPGVSIFCTPGSDLLPAIFWRLSCPSGFCAVKYSVNGSVFTRLAKTANPLSPWKHMTPTRFQPFNWNSWVSYFSPQRECKSAVVL